MGDILFLFDVDGTLTKSRQQADESILKMLRELKKKVKIAFVGGSDLAKQKEQIGPQLLEIFDYGFPENGVVYYKKGELVSSDSLLGFLGEEEYKRLINRLLFLLAETDCPKKRGNFLELRTSMLNCSPVGRSCTQEERMEFHEYDKKTNLRRSICEVMKKEFPQLSFVVGGQISIDVFPCGWDKTYCLRHISEKTIYFFGDMTQEGGNDYELYINPAVKGHRVASCEDTMRQVNESLKELGIEELSSE